MIEMAGYPYYSVLIAEMCLFGKIYYQQISTFNVYLLLYELVQTFGNEFESSTDKLMQLSHIL